MTQRPVAKIWLVNTKPSVWQEPSRQVKAFDSVFTSLLFFQTSWSGILTNFTGLCFSYLLWAIPLRVSSKHVLDFREILKHTAKRWSKTLTNGQNCLSPAPNTSFSTERTSLLMGHYFFARALGFLNFRFLNILKYYLLNYLTNLQQAQKYTGINFNYISRKIF